MNKSTGLLQLYRRLLRDHFVVVQAVQTGILMGTGDVIAQTFVERKSLKQINLARTTRFFAIGTVIVGPTLSVWYKVLTKTFGHAGKSVALKKMALDQIVFAPTFLAIFITLINLLEGHDWKFVKEQMRLKYFDVILTNYKIWPAVQLFNFYFIPWRHQVLLAQTVALFWNAYLSWKTQQGIE